MQRIDLGPALAMVLQAHLGREIEKVGETSLELGLAIDLSANVADDAAQTGAQEPERLAGALELMRVAVAAHHDGGALGDAQIALAQRHALALGEADELDDGAVHEASIGRMGDRLGLHRGVNGDALEVLGRDRAGFVRDRQALLDQRHDLLFAQALAPAGQRGAIEGELVAEALLAAEILVIGILEPTRAQRLVREVVHVLQDEEPRHQPRRQPGLTRTRLAHRAKAPIEELPIDLPR